MLRSRESLTDRTPRHGRRATISPASRMRSEMSDLSDILGIAVYHRPDGTVVIRLVGSLDAAGAARLVHVVASSEPTGGGDLALHVEAVESLDSAGIRALFHAEALVRVNGGRLVLVSPSRGVQLGLEEAAVERHFEVESETAGPATADVHFGLEGGPMEL